MTNTQFIATYVTVDYKNPATGHVERGTFDVRIDVAKLVSGIAHRAVKNKSKRTVARHGAIQIELKALLDDVVSEQ